MTTKNKNFWHSLPKPILILAPMAGYTESPFRSLVREIEPSTILVSELLSVEALRRKNEKTMRMAFFSPQEKGYFCIQLFGGDTQGFIDAARVVEELGADGIDLNFGCPSPKVIGSGYGSALLKDPEASAGMIEKLVNSTKLPVSVKMRLGFYDDFQLIDTAKNFESAGISALAIHGRTTKQKFAGEANWEKIYEVKDHLSIPVIGNGDVTTAEEAVAKIKNLDGVMVGRASLRNPWIFRQVRCGLEGKEIPAKPSLREQLDFFRRHAHLTAEMKGEKRALLELRKHFAHFVRDVKNASMFRDRLIRVETLCEMEEIFVEMAATSLPNPSSAHEYAAPSPSPFASYPESF